MGEWSNGLFGCFNDCGLCIITYFVPCYTAGKIAEKTGESCCTYGCLSILGPIGIYTRAKTRAKVRESKGIEGEFCNDCIMHWFCGICSIIQEAQEVDALDRGGQQQAMARQ
ncbi:protein PLANT CADMIUM RESISTANCE 2-like [Haliotis rufescens]|uniref:protein PLANT CADMIUM RESISTANCE 2-like n=1 Tax=Haliotis rufescens TaxID=6454 RepID=UPI001EAFEEC1|nr:protein PLANT CADMIUM RESISTANCE 2-like [Haliotis rufescens]